MAPAVIFSKYTPLHVLYFFPEELKAALFGLLPALEHLGTSAPHSIMTPVRALFTLSQSCEPLHVWFGLVCLLCFAPQHTPL